MGPALDRQVDLRSSFVFPFPLLPFSLLSPFLFLPVIDVSVFGKHHRTPSRSVVGVGSLRVGSVCKPWGIEYRTV